MAFQILPCYSWDAVSRIPWIQRQFLEADNTLLIEVKIIMNERKKAVVNLAASGLKPADESNDAHKNLGDSRFGVGLSRLLSTYVLTPYLQTMTRRYLKMEPVQMDMLPGPQAGRGYTLYLHVPFCESLCPYCSFNRFLFDEEKAHGYFRRLREEMRMAHGLGYRF